MSGPGDSRGNGTYTFLSLLIEQFLHEREANSQGSPLSAIIYSPLTLTSHVTMKWNATHC